MPGEEIFYLSVSELAKRIESKKLSPVELTQVYLDRSQKFGPRFNAYAMLTPEIALDQAKTAEKEIQRGHYRGPLHGIPYAAKDLLAVKGIPTTWGAKPYANQVFDYNATVIDHLKNVGAVIDAASNSGANSIDGISFVLRQTSPARGQALAEATQQAMNKANSIAQALGGRVLRVLEENEASTVNGEMSSNYDAMTTAGLSNRQPTPISTGQLNIKSNVQLIVEIES